MLPIEEAILRTVIYADVFDFPLKAEEIHNFLICSRVFSLSEVKHSLKTSPLLCAELICLPPYYMLAGREALANQRASQEPITDKLMHRARTYGAWLARLPFVKMVAVTGSLAVRNPTASNDDLDYFLLVEPGRVWLARAFAILLVRAGRIAGAEVCPNYVLASDQLTQKRQDLFIAREISQMIPLYGMQHYTAFRQANRWAQGFQPNAHRPFYAQPPISLGGWASLKRFGEWILRGRAGELLENWEYRRKQHRFKQKITQNNQTAAEISKSSVKGHFSDYGSPALKTYAIKLAEYGLAP